METLGQEFKHRREERKLSLRDVADGTRVGVRFLTAIEADDFAALPGGIYTRSFVRAYAKFLGMDEEDVLARYRKQVAIEEPVEPMMSYKEYPNESSSMTLWVGLLALLGVILGGGYGLIYYLDLKSPTSTVSNVTSPTPVASPVDTASPAPNPTATPTPSQTPLAAVLEQVVLTLKTTQPAWVSVNTDDIEKAFITTIPANTSRDFKADSKLQVIIGNFPAVAVEINGRSAKLPTVNSGLTAKAVITKENYQQYIVDPNAPVATPTPKVPKPSITGAKPPTGALTAPNTTSTPNPTLSPKPKKTPTPDETPSGTGLTTLPPDPNATPTPKIRKPKPVETPTEGDGGRVNLPPGVGGSTASPKPKVIKPADGTGATPTGTPKPATPKPKTTPSAGSTTGNPSGAGNTGNTTPKPKTSPKPANNTEAKPN